MPIAAGLLATALITVCVVPQVLAAIRSADAAGVSTTAAAQASLTCAAWAAYALAAGINVTAWSSASGALLWGLVAIVAAARTRDWPSPSVTGCSLVIVLLAAAGGLAVLGAVLLMEAVVTTVPQARQARRRVRGVALSTYVMMCAGASCWVVYGVGAGDWPLSVSSLVKAVVCAYIAARVRAGRRRPHPPPRPSRTIPATARAGAS